MPYKRSMIIGLLIMILMSMGSCAVKHNPGNYQKCVSPAVDMIPDPMPQYKEYGTERYKRPPNPEWWKPQLPWFKSRQLPKGVPKDLVYLSRSVWIVYKGNEWNGIVRYDIDTGKVSHFQIIDGNDDKLTIADLHVHTDGTLWASALSISKGISYLAVYEKQSNQFVIVKDQEELLTSSPNSIRERPSNLKQYIQSLPDGNLVVVSAGNIISYNPEKNTSQTILKKEYGLYVSSIKVQSDGKIWFINRESERFDLRLWDPDSKKAIRINFPDVLMEELSEATISCREFVIDDQNRLWISYYGWFESDDQGGYEWVSLDRSPVLVSVYDNDYFRYRWSGIWSAHYFSDHKIWFSAVVGIVSYDLESGEWCLSSPKVSPAIIEDPNGSLWIVAIGERQIYQYELDK